MAETRSASQILFGYLPEQTVDVAGGVWKVNRWREPAQQQNVNSDALAREVCRVALPWRQAGLDGGLVDDLTQGRSRIKVLTLDRERGIELDPFPRIWICKNCRRIHSAPDSRCPCGDRSRKGQLHFVGYCERCGAIREPWIPTCRQHHEAMITFPGTASGAEILFSCPSCGTELRKGFGFPNCNCGGGRLRFTVHRAASVFTPRGIVLVNPPSPERVAAIEAAGGLGRALTWMLEGMPKQFASTAQETAESLTKRLRQTGLTDDVISRMVAVAIKAGAIATERNLPRVPELVRGDAEIQALTVALGMSDGRMTFGDLRESVPPASALAQRYESAYPKALSAAGLERVDFVDSFPVLTGYFGYTRGAFDPGASRLRGFREATGDYIVYGDLAETEALFVQLSPQHVARWLGRSDQFPDRTAAHLAVLEECARSGADAIERLTVLVHSFSHRLIRIAALHAGIERNSLSELLVPLHFGFFIYAAARGGFVLGGLQAVFESALDQLLTEFVTGDHRCPLDPGCARVGSACVACLHLGEPSCRYFNTKLSREALSGRSGYFSLVRQLRE